jgi:hypothetical protein
MAMHTEHEGAGLEIGAKAVKKGDAHSFSYPRSRLRKLMAGDYNKWGPLVLIICIAIAVPALLWTPIANLTGDAPPA